jgi:uncharacterized cupin superfamily protein
MQTEYASVIAHWDEVEWRLNAKGPMDAEWQFLGRVAGTVGVGVNRVRVAPGKLPTPPHSHSASEELYYVLGGSGLAWQDGDVHEVRPGDCVIQRADEMEHTFVAGPDGLEYLVFGTRHATEVAWLPRSRAIRFDYPWVEGRDDNPWDVESQVGELEHGDPAPRPANIVNVDEVELEESVPGRLWTASLATRETSKLAGLHWERIEPAKTNGRPHCHSEEEEVFVVLEGDGTLELWPSPIQVQLDSKREDVPIRAGHVVARPPATRIGHRFRAGANGLTMLTYGTRKANDICWYPRSNTIFLRGIGVVARVEPLDYDDGEPDD